MTSRVFAETILIVSAQHGYSCVVTPNLAIPVNFAVGCYSNLFCCTLVMVIVVQRCYK